MAKTDVLQYDYENYHIEALKSGSLTGKEIRAEYSRLRKIANRRIEALGRSKFKTSQAYIQNVNKYVALDKIKNERDLMYRLHDLANFVTSKSGSVTGQYEIRRKTLETLHERGITFVNAKNLEAFGEFMEEARTKLYSRIYGSERIKDMFGIAEKKGINPQELFKDFAYWMQNREKLEAMPKIKNKRNLSSDDYKKAIEKLENSKQNRKKKR